MASLTDVLEQARPPRQTLRLCLRGDLTTRIEELHGVYVAKLREDDNFNRPPEAPAVAEEIVALEAEAEAASVDFVLESMGAQVWNEMLAAHPPTKDDLALGRDHNPRTFPYEAISLSLIEPTDATAEAVKALEEQMSFGQWHRLWLACLAVNVIGGDIPKFDRLSALNGRSGSKPTTPAPAESPGPRS